MEEKHPLPIKQWSEEDRPREKMLLQGAAVLSDAELLAILIGTGTRTDSAVDLARKLLLRVDNDLNRLGRLNVSDLSGLVRGVGPAKATSVAAALELGRRRHSERLKEDETIQSSAQVARYFVAMLSDLPHEEFWVLLLNRSNKAIGRFRVSAGGVHQTTVDPRLIFRLVVQHLASSLVLVHNHPSGNLEPSLADRELTRKIQSAASLVDVRVLDHLVIARGKYYSFLDNGLL